MERAALFGYVHREFLSLGENQGVDTQQEVFMSREFVNVAIVAGAGIWGCALARRLAETGRKDG